MPGRDPVTYGTREIQPLELALALEAGEAIQVVDVRAPFRLRSGRIDSVPDERFHNLVGSELGRRTDLEGTGIDPALPVAVVCGLGNDSRNLAAHLERLGCDARSLAGGMTAWMDVVLPREVAPPPSLDRLVQFDRVGKGALGYLLVSDGEALVVDPPRDPGAWAREAARTDATIVAVADTHVHADYLSGGPKLAERLSVPYRLHPADAVYPYDGTPGRLVFDALEDAEMIRVGRAAVTASHTPGHTEGSVCFRVDDRVLTGDLLFVTSVGRPDLAGRTAEWTADLWRSLERCRREWPADTLVLPAHYGSDAERRDDRVVAARFGDLPERNEALRLPDREAFAGWVQSRAAAFPEAYRRIKAANVGLLQPDEAEARELEAGKNECALGGS